MVLFLVLNFVLMIVPFLVLHLVLMIVLFSKVPNLVLMIVLFLVLKAATDLTHWAFKSWCSFPACVIYEEPLCNS